MSNSDETLFMEAAERLRRTAHEGRSFGAAQVKIVGLDDIRERAGANWDRMKDRVRTTSSHFLQARLSKDDLVIPCGDGFLIVYADSEGRDLNTECEHLRGALDQFYLGEDETASLSTQVSAKSITTSEMIAVIGAPPPAEKAQTAVQFVPTWNVAHEVVSMYIAGPALMKPAPHLAYDSAFRLTGQHRTTDFLALDLQILDHAACEAEALLSSGRRCLVGFCVHSSTLQKRTTRSAYRERLAQIPSAVRPYLIARISEIEPGAPSVTVGDWTAFLRHFISRVVLELHPRQKHFSGLETVRAWGASCALPPAALANAEARERTRAVIKRWNSELHRRGLLFLLENVLDPLLLGAACGAPVDFVSGSTLWPFTEKPAGIVPCHRQSLMRSPPHVGRAPSRDPHRAAG